MGRKRTTPPVLTPVVHYPATAVLTVEQVAAGLGVSVSTVERADLPAAEVAGPRSVRYVWGQVLRTLEERAKRRIA